MGRWRGPVLVGEAWRNVATRPLQSALVGLLTLAIFVAPALSDVRTVTALERTNRQLIAAGGTSVEVTSGSGGLLPAADCERLNGQDGIVAAGGLTSASVEYASSSPALGFGVAHSVGDVVAAVTGKPGTTGQAPGLVISTELADQLGVSAGSYLNLDGALTRVAQVAALDVRDPLLGRLAIYPSAPTGEVQSCVVQFDPGSYGAGASALADFFGGIKDLKVAPFVPVNAGTVSPASQWRHRITRDGWAIGAVLAFLIYLLVSLLRRHELSVYLLTGTRRSEVAVMHLLHEGIITTMSALSALLWIAFLSRVGHSSELALRAGLRSIVLTALALSTLMPLTVAWLARRDFTRQLRERAG